MRRSEIDWSGLKFKIAEEMGDSMDVPWVFYDEKNDHYRYHLMNHQDYDGVGGITKLLEQYRLLGSECQKFAIKNHLIFLKEYGSLKNLLISQKKSTFAGRRELIPRDGSKVFYSLFYQRTHRRINGDV